MVDFQDPGASNQSEVPTNTMGSQDPGASNQTGEQTATVDFSEPGPINQTEVPNVGTTDYSSPQNVPDVEYPVHDISPGNIPPPFPEHVATEPVESGDQIFSNEKEIHSPIVDSGEHSFEFQQHSEAPPSAISHEVPEMSFASLQFAIQSTPLFTAAKSKKAEEKVF
ncbi:hypothetical protein LWI29_007928 [Acer saccharum]|uniref:Uncharacterized protein n=1 Tax=Acer saccharum TaxID=4024 RepID=A0AA39SA29_ACESA|nr:hypothetical protein LWI29_007928 [Acer saccharum]